MNRTCQIYSSGLMEQRAKKADMNTYQILETVFFGWQPNEL
jgi:hypothetical protein